MNVIDSTLSLIGNTPLKRLNKVTDGLEADVLVKCEYFNPSGSIKDRMALRMIEEVEKSGRLRKGGTIIDQTSGNTGPALSFVGNVKDYNVRLFIPSEWVGVYNPENRIKIMRYFGAEVVNFKTTGYEEVLKRLKPDEESALMTIVGMKKCFDLEQSDPNVWWANQSCNPNNTAAHRDSTGREILEQTDGKVDAFVASVGTGGTLLGIAEALRKENPSVELIGLVPEDTLITDWVKNHIFDQFFEEFGMPKYKFIIETMFEKGIPDQIRTVKDEYAREMANRLCKEEGLFCGMSSGANVYAAIQLAKKMRKGEKVVTVLVDRRDRYYLEDPVEHYVI
ncbi:MAG: PLP-dependent cysteine synthase family protein [Promethearchaeota archaeon]|jgi:cysteine synthase